MFGKGRSWLRRISVALLLLTGSTAWPIHGEAWVELGDLNHRRGEHANAVINGQIYTLGGIFDSRNGPAEVERFDPATGRWVVIEGAEMPSDRYRHHVTAGSSVYGESIWIVGGRTPKRRAVDWVDVYNTSTNTWARGPDLPVASFGGASVIVGDTLHFFGGSRSNNIDKTLDVHYTLDLTDVASGWRAAPSLPKARVHVAGVAVGEKIYIIGGEINHGHDGDTADVQIYDTKMQTWSVGAPIPRVRSHHEWATFVERGEIWSVGGVDSNKPPPEDSRVSRGQSEIYIYHPESDTWREFKTPLPGELVSPGAKIIDGTLYVFGGGVKQWFAGDMTSTFALDVSDGAP